MKLPEINIYYSRFLSPIFEVYVRETEKDWKIPADEIVKERIENQRQAWKKEEQKILEGLSEVIGLSFYQNVIDVYIVAVRRGAFSNPIVIGSQIQGESFVDVLTHELIHRLLTHCGRKIDWEKFDKETYPNISEKKTLTHILIHAIHKHIYLNVLQSPSRLEKDIKMCQGWPNYQEAWEIVERDGYQNIIEKLKTFVSNYPAM
jgi:hypothetical protein